MCWGERGAGREQRGLGGGGGVVSIRVRSNPIPAIVTRVTLALCPHAGLV